MNHIGKFHCVPSSREEEIKLFIAEKDLSSQHHSQQHYSNPYEYYCLIGDDNSDNIRTRSNRRGSSPAAPANNLPATQTRQKTSPPPMARPPMPSNETVNSDHSKAFVQTTSKNSRINVSSNDENGVSSRNSPVKQRTSRTRKRPIPPSPLEEDNIPSLTKTPKEDKIPAEIRKIINQTTNKKSVNSYNLEKIMSMLKGREEFVEKKANDSVLFEYLIGAVMSELPRRLRRIYQRKPNKCPIQIIALVLKYEFVEYKMETASLDEIKKFVQEDRILWGIISGNGNYVNMGQHPNEDDGTVFITAFGTKKDIGYNKGTDKMDKMNSINHTIRYMKRNIFRDYLLRIGYSCSEDEAERIFDENIGMFDLWNELGLYLEGNEWDGFDYQLLARYLSFCDEFKDDLEIDGVSVIERKPYYHYNGIHIAALSSALDLAIRARMRNLYANKPLHVFIHSSRVLRLLCGEPEAGKNEYEVRYNENIVVGGAPHPNRQQRNITNHSLEDVKEMDISYSVACAPIATILGTEGNQSDSWEQRWLHRNGMEAEVGDNSEFLPHEVNEIKAKTTATVLECEETKRKTCEIQKETKVIQKETKEANKKKRDTAQELKKLDKVLARAERTERLKSEKAQRSL